MKFRKKPDTVEAIQLTHQSLKNIENLVRQPLDYRGISAYNMKILGINPLSIEIYVNTCNVIFSYAVVSLIREGEYVVKEENGRIFSLTAEAFNKRYELDLSC